MTFETRAGTKLAHALSSFAFNPAEGVCVDLGSHEGGFVDCLLQHGAPKVHSVDTSYGTLAWKLRQDPRVVIHERRNALHWRPPEPVHLVTIDVGWTPQARFFTLTLYNTDGKLVPNALNRNNFTSQELIRKADGSFQISVGPRARPGNWLPTGGMERYVLVLRLYDTPVGIATRAGRETPMPSVSSGRCL